MKLAGSQILVVGASGFIGQALAHKLKVLGAEALGLVKREESRNLCPRGVETVAVDIRDREKLKRALS